MFNLKLLLLLFPISGFSQNHSEIKLLQLDSSVVKVKKKHKKIECQHLFHPNGDVLICDHLMHTNGDNNNNSVYTNYLPSINGRPAQNNVYTIPTPCTHKLHKEHIVPCQHFLHPKGD